MTRDEVRAYLRRPRKMESEIRRKEIRIQELRAALLPAAILYESDRVQTSPGDKMSEIMAEVDRLEREIADLQLEKAAAMIKIAKDLDSLPDRHAEALNLIFIARKTEEDTADIMAYSVRHIRRLIGEGLEMLSCYVR